MPTRSIAFNKPVSGTPGGFEGMLPDGLAVYDIREWSPDHAKMGKGVTLTAEELKKIRDLLNGMNL